MAGFLARLLDIRPGEGGLVIRSTAVLFGLISAHTILETARDALFLEKISASRLPLVYALLAALALVLVRWNTAFVTRFGRRNALIFTLLFSAYGTFVLYQMPLSSAVVFGLYTWSALLGTLLVAQFWMLAGQSFTVSQGKRLFGPISAGGVLGAVVGASASLGFLRMMPVHQLLLGSAAIFLLTSLMLTSVPNDSADTALVVTEEEETAAKGMLSEITQRPYLLRVVMLIGISTGAVLVADYLFKSIVAKSMPAADLGNFFASAYTVMNAVALVVQLTMAQYLVKRIGVIASYTILPSLLMLGGAATLVTGGAVAATLLVKGSDGALRHSLHRIATELLWMPLSDDIRNKVKTFVDTVVVRGVQALIAAVLFGMAMAGADGAVPLSVLIIGLAGLWLFLAMRLRQPYLDLFRNALQRRPEQVGGLRLDLQSVELVIEALSSRDPNRALGAIELLVDSKRTRLIPALILYHESDVVLLRALEAIATPERKDWVPQAQRLLQHPSDPVRVAAVQALARIGDLADVEGRLFDTSPAVRGHAAFWVAERKGGEPEKHEEIQILLEMGGTAGREAQIGLVEAIGHNGHQGWANVLLKLCQSDDPALIEAAVKAVGRAGDQRFLPLMIERLRTRQGRSAVREAIVTIGEAALDALETALDDPTTHRLVRRHLPRTISRFRTQRAADILMRTLEREADGYVRYKALRGLGRMVAESPVRVDRRRVELQVKRNLIEHLRIISILVPLRPGLSTAPAKAAAPGDLLLGLLEDKRVQSLDRAFRLLQIAHRREDVRSTALAVGSSDKRLRAQGLEYLDALTLFSPVREIQDLFRVIADDLPDAERVARSVDFLPKPPIDFDESLSHLLKDNDESLVGIVAGFVIEYGLDELRLDVSQLTRDGVKMPSLESLVRRFEATRGTASVA